MPKREDQYKDGNKKLGSTSHRGKQGLGKKLASRHGKTDGEAWLSYNPYKVEA
jgi:hypothetical protein